ncbi:MAG: hypothetical protein ACT4P6_03885 [Gemmatimonadaceae bacterium]
MTNDASDEISVPNEYATFLMCLLALDPKKSVAVWFCAKRYRAVDFPT